MKNKHFFLLLLIVALLIASIIKGFSQDSTSYTYTIKVPVKVVHDTVTITKPIPVYIHDTVYVPRLIYKCPDTPIVITPSKDSLKFSAFNSSFKKWVDELIKTKKVGLLDRNVPVNEAVNFIGDFTIIGVNRPTLTISSSQLFWLKEGNHIFMRGNSTFKPSFNWKPPIGLIITEPIKDESKLILFPSGDFDGTLRYDIIEFDTVEIAGYRLLRKKDSNPITLPNWPLIDYNISPIDISQFEVDTMTYPIIYAGHENASLISDTSIGRLYPFDKRGLSIGTVLMPIKEYTDTTPLGEQIRNPFILRQRKEKLYNK